MDNRKNLTAWSVIKWTILLPVTLLFQIIRLLYRLNLLHWIIMCGLIYILFDYTCYAFAFGAFIPAAWWDMLSDLPDWARYALVYGIGGTLTIIEALLITINARHTVKIK